MAGKGDKSRTSNWKAYRDGMDRIFKKKDEIRWRAHEAPVGEQQLNKKYRSEERDGQVVEYCSWEDENGNRTTLNLSCLDKTKF